MKRLSLLLLSTLLSLTANDTDITNDNSKAYELYLTPVPVIGVNPAFGFIYGVGASASMYLGDPKSTRISNMLAGIAKTTNDQLIMTFKSTAYLSDDSWILIGDWRYLDSSQPTYGLGTGPQSSKLATDGSSYEDKITGTMSPAQMMEFQYIRIYETALKRIKDDFYLGLGYHLDSYSNIKDNPLDLNSNPKVITSHYGYSKKHGFDPTQSMLSGISLNAMFDSRDSVINPYIGRYAFASYRYNSELIGSDQDSSTLWLEYRDYFNLTPKKEYPNVLAFWAYGNFLTSGNVPYMDLGATSYDQYAKSGRGYVQGRFRGEQSLYLEGEYRQHLGIWRVPFTKFDMPIGGVLFANAQTMSSEGNDITLGQYIEPGAGLGLRFMLQKKTRTNLTLDYGFGNYQSSGLYLRLNETF